MWKQKLYSRWLLAFSLCSVFFGAYSTKALDLVISNDSGSTALYWYSELINEHGGRPAGKMKSGYLGAGESMKAGYGLLPFGDYNSAVKPGAEIIVYAYRENPLQPELTTQFFHAFNNISHVTWKLADNANQVCVIHLNNPNQISEWLLNEIEENGSGGGTTDVSGIESRLDDLIEATEANNPDAPVPEIPDNEAEEEDNEEAVDEAIGPIAAIFERAFGIDAAVAGVDGEIFKVAFDVGGENHEVNFDPREKPLMMAGSQLFKALICSFAFYLLINYLWNWYEKKVASLALTNPSGTSGEAVLGTNANLATSAVNAGIIMLCLITFITIVVALIVTMVGGSAVSEFVASDQVITGEHSAWGGVSGQQILVFLDMIIPVTCILSCVFTYMIVRITGHTIWMGCTTIIKFANA
jgi:hypothetical protein